MTQFPDDDPKLTQFLRQNRPQPPSASSSLEDRILTAIEQPQQPRQSRHRRWYRSRWIPPAIAAGLIASLVSYRTLVPVRTNPTDVASLEAFVENSWQGSVSDAADEEQFPLNDPTVN